MDLMYGTTLPCMAVEGCHGSVYEYFHDSELSQKYQFTPEDWTHAVIVSFTFFLSHCLFSS
jgi:hypothetical protein